jgi:hypothetical protein
VLEVEIVPQVPIASALPHTWTLKWVYKELGSATLTLLVELPIITLPWINKHPDNLKDGPLTNATQLIIV